MPTSLHPEQFLAARTERILLDVRTPAEYAAGHIPGALNLPLFSDEERAEVGTLYKQAGPEAALLKGLEFAGARLRHYVEAALRAAPARKVAIHCWRGGQRSGSMAWLLTTAGFDVVTLNGGYKAYRKYLFEQLALRPARLVVLGGKTGSGKTRILHALQSDGEQVIDLEALAHHKGSAFGAIGEMPQPSFEQFANDLFDAFAALDPRRQVWVESESKAIGKVQIPDEFWRRICEAPMIEVDIPLEQRIAHLVEVYAGYPRAELAGSYYKIARRLGGLNLRLALEALEAGDYPAAAVIALAYYDKTYRHSLDTMNKGPHFTLSPHDFDAAHIAAQLIELTEQNNLWN